ncbi:MAG: hypothetical protein JW751_07600 [Polyangiaceae bacterium]|nr:hypothetical protein [Polyangiaceae bacterium]
MKLIVGVLGLGLAFGVAGCKKKTNTQTGYATYGTSPQTGYGTGTQTGYQTAPATGTGTGTGTGTDTGAATAAGAACTEIDAAAATVAQPLITAMSSASVPPGAKPLGAVIAANCPAGGRITKPIQMQPGKCYTVVGAGVGITELNMELRTIPVAGVAPVVSQDQETGSQAVIGKHPNCYKWAWPMGGTMNIDIIAAAGSGVVGAQVYEK